MPISVILEMDDKSLSNAGQEDVGINIGMVASFEEENEEDEFTKADFEKALKKVSRRIKK